jgi:hypothetical protein
LALQLTFDSDRLVYPMRMSAAAPAVTTPSVSPMANLRRIAATERTLDEN